MYHVKVTILSDLRITLLYSNLICPLLRHDARPSAMTTLLIAIFSDLRLLQSEVLMSVLKNELTWASWTPSRSRRASSGGPSTTD